MTKNKFERYCHHNARFNRRKVYLLYCLHLSLYALTIAFAATFKHQVPNCMPLDSTSSMNEIADDNKLYCSSFETQMQRISFVSGMGQSYLECILFFAQWQEPRQTPVQDSSSISKMISVTKGISDENPEVGTVIH